MFKSTVMLRSVTIKTQSNERIPFQHHTMHFNYQSLLVLLNFHKQLVLKPLCARYLCHPLVVVFQGPILLYLAIYAKSCVAF